MVSYRAFHFPFTLSRENCILHSYIFFSFEVNLFTLISSFVHILSLIVFLFTSYSFVRWQNLSIFCVSYRHTLIIFQYHCARTKGVQTAWSCPNTRAQVGLYAMPWPSGGGLGLQSTKSGDIELSSSQHSCSRQSTSPAIKTGLLTIALFGERKRSVGKVIKSVGFRIFFIKNKKNTQKNSNNNNN